MGKRKIVIKQSVASSVARVSWFIESKGLIATAEKYTDRIYDFFETIADDKKSHPSAVINKEPLSDTSVFLLEENIRSCLLRPIQKLLSANLFHLSLFIGSLNTEASNKFIERPF